MSESIQAQTALSVPASSNSGYGAYTLSDDLARLCLPQEYKDSYRTLAWVNSICALFLAVGLVGLKAPRVIVRPLSELNEPVPVIWTPPEEQPKPTTEPQPDETEPQPSDQPSEAPPVVAIVAAADSAGVAFAVPVQGAVAVAQAVHLATPPPPIVKAPPARPTQFNPHAAATEGSFPDPEYPGTALRNRYQGTVIIEIIVDENGVITSAKVFKTSGFSVLDEAALKVVQTRWRFTPGPKRWLHWPCTFKMQ